MRRKWATVACGWKTCCCFNSRPYHYLSGLLETPTITGLFQTGLFQHLALLCTQIPPFHIDKYTADPHAHTKCPTSFQHMGPRSLFCVSPWKPSRLCLPQWHLTGDRSLSECVNIQIQQSNANSLRLSCKLQCLTTWLQGGEQSAYQIECYRLPWPCSPDSGG